MAYRVGEEIAFEGWADDYDKSIAAIEFSLDEGASWTRYRTDGTRAGVWVYWRFSYAPRRAGAYRLQVRSVNEDGVSSPVPACIEFDVAE